MRRALLALTAAVVVVAPGAPPAAAADTSTGRLLVTLRQDDHAGARAATAHAAVARAAIARAGAAIAGPVEPSIGLVTVRAPKGVASFALAAVLRRLPGVERVQAEHRYRLRAQPDDPALTEPETAPGTPAGTPVEWWAQRENLFAAWDITRGQGAKVAVIDTGVDGNHPEFAGRIVQATDNDGNPSHGGATGDENGHGTHVASLACGAGDNGVGLAGAGLGCSLLVFKTDLSDASVATSIVQAVEQGADAINMSFGTDGSRPPADAIVRAVDLANQRGVVLVAAAADNPVQEQGDPANILQPSGTAPDITQGKGLTVTAANFADQRATFAGSGTEISMAAYGAFQGGGPPGLLGAFPGNTTELERGSLLGNGPCGCRTTFDGDGRYAYLQGTSMAAPMVTGVAALAHHLNPDLSAADVVRILKQTARRAAGGWTPDLGWGILDGGAALAAARAVDRRAPTSKVRGPGSTTRRRTLALRITSADQAPPGLIASGVAGIELWRAANGGQARRLRTLKRDTTLHVKTRPGSRYAFFTVAVDRAGNREVAPKRADTRVLVARNAR